MKTETASPLKVHRRSNPTLACLPVARKVVTWFTLFASLLMLALPAAAAQSSDDASDNGVVPVIQVGGFLDSILADFVVEAIERADADPRTRAVVLEVNSDGAVVDQDRLNAVAAAIADAEVGVTVWIGPSRARATGAVAQLVSLADRVALAPGARLGDTGASELDARFGTPWGDNAESLFDRTINWEEAIDLGIQLEADGCPAGEKCGAPIIGEFVAQLATEFPVVLSTVISDEDGTTSTQVESSVRFERLSVFKGWLHSVASAPVAYLLFAIGMLLLVFEFYTAGVGLAGIIGASCFMLGAYGLGVLPTRTWAIVLMVLSMLAYAVDVQAGIPRFWTGVGTLLFVIATFGLFKDGVELGWVPIVSGILVVFLMAIVGMPTMVRTRFSTPTIDRDSMVGLEGVAIEDVNPAGVVELRDARMNESLWQATADSESPIAAGDRIRVSAIDGLLLEVESVESATS